MSEQEKIRKQVIEVFQEFGGWWRLEGMAEWIDAPIDDVRVVYDGLESDGLLDRKDGH